jgi:DNA-binding NarL/FixJ family response regulator
VPNRRPPKPPVRRERRDDSPLIRIVIADHHAIDRGGMAGMLENEGDFVVVGEAATLEEVLVQCRALTPDVLVLTMNLPSNTEDSPIPRLRRELPELKVLAMSDRGTHNCLVLNPPSRRRHLDDDVHARCELGTDCLALAVAHGARGTLRRSADPEDLFRGIRAVAAGQSWFDPATTTGLVSISERSTPRDALSERELDVAALIGEGRSNKEISTALGISEPTVKKHVGHILDKLGLQDRLQAGLHIARNPLLVVRPPVADRAPRSSSARRSR